MPAATRPPKTPPAMVPLLDLGLFAFVMVEEVGKGISVNEPDKVCGAGTKLTGCADTSVSSGAVLDTKLSECTDTADSVGEGEQRRRG